MRRKGDNEVSWLRRIKPTLDELTIIDMRRDYRVFRERYFGRSIPPVHAVLFGVTTGPVMLGTVQSRDCLGFYLNSVIDDYSMTAIVVSDESGPAQRALTILHEMAHLKVDLKFKRFMGHGKYWQREMKRLAGLGAFKKFW